MPPATIEELDADGNAVPLPDGTMAPFVLFPAADVAFHDTWHVSGLKGTGSGDYSVDEVTVPAGRWVQVGDPPRVGRALYRFSFLGALAVGVTAVGLGLARRAGDELVDLAAGKRPQGSSTPATPRAGARRCTNPRPSSGCSATSTSPPSTPWWRHARWRSWVGPGSGSPPTWVSCERHARR